ncbi:hypothetical protein AK51_08315 [Serratia nematodiphila DZ0503SBS1]|nr:hypothetical protein AK51_08315 [Serratia nematodiphila DZ0503SBS1]
MRLAPLLIIQRAAAMRQPAHDHFVLAQHLLAIDAEVLPFLMRAAGHRQPPGDQRRGVFRPAVHHRNTAQIDIVALPYLLLTRRGSQHLGRHVQHLLELWHFVEQIAEAFRRLRFFEERQQFADFAQRADVFLPHAHRHAIGGAEQVTEHRHIIPFRVFKQQCRTARSQGAIGNLRHFQVRIDRLADAF